MQVNSPLNVKYMKVSTNCGRLASRTAPSKFDGATSIKVAPLTLPKPSDHSFLLYVSKSVYSRKL